MADLRVYCTLYRAQGLQQIVFWPPVICGTSVGGLYCPIPEDKMCLASGFGQWNESLSWMLLLHHRSYSPSPSSAHQPTSNCPSLNRFAGGLSQKLEGYSAPRSAGQLKPPRSSPQPMTICVNIPSPLFLERIMLSI